VSDYRIEHSSELRKSSMSAKQFEHDHGSPSAQQHDADLVLSVVSSMLPYGKNDSSSIAEAHHGRQESTMTSKKSDAALSASTQRQENKVRLLRTFVCTLNRCHNAYSKLTVLFYFALVTLNCYCSSSSIVCHSTGDKFDSHSSLDA
jgi:hypothetical protein